MKVIKLKGYPEISGFIDLYSGLEDGTEEFETAERMEGDIESEVWGSISIYSFDRGDNPVEVFNQMVRFLKNWDGGDIYWYEEDRSVIFSTTSPKEYGKLLSIAIDKVTDEYTKNGLWPPNKGKL